MLLTSLAQLPIAAQTPFAYASFAFLSEWLLPQPAATSATADRHMASANTVRTARV